MQRTEATAIEHYEIVIISKNRNETITYHSTIFRSILYNFGSRPAADKGDSPGHFRDPHLDGKHHASSFLSQLCLLISYAPGAPSWTDRFDRWRWTGRALNPPTPTGGSVWSRMWEGSVKADSDVGGRGAGKEPQGRKT